MSNTTVEILKYYTDNISKVLEFRAQIMHDAFGIDPSQDFDQWDMDAYHVVARIGDNIVGYYRGIVNSALGFYTESEFDISPLDIDRDSILEIGRAAVDPNFRNPVIIPMLWSELISLAGSLGKNYIMGAASLKAVDTDIYSVRDVWREKYQYLTGRHALPKMPYNQPTISDGSAPKLLQVYERLGAQVVSDPSWDPVFNTADVVTILDLDKINQRWLEKLA
jgi:putative hemolysin